MSADEFFVISHGKDAKDAFSKAVREARYMEGCGGYTGTIAEKHSFIEFALPAGMTIDAYVDRVRDAMPNGSDKSSETDPNIKKAGKIYDDKWGPAVCVRVPEKDKEKDKAYAFFGYASS